MFKIIRRHRVIEKTGLSKSTIYEAIESGDFPKPVQLTTRTVGWLESEIDSWIKSRKPAMQKNALKQEPAID